MGIGRMWKNGGKYVGEYKEGLFHGQGTYNFANGDKYVGEWKESLFHGQGTYTYADGTFNSGLFRNHEFIVE